MLYALKTELQMMIMLTATSNVSRLFTICALSFLMVRNIHSHMMYSSICIIHIHISFWKRNQEINKNFRELYNVITINYSVINFKCNPGFHRCIHSTDIVVNWLLCGLDWWCSVISGWKKGFNAPWLTLANKKLIHILF